MKYTIRSVCIICNSFLENTFFKNDLKIPLASYLINNIDNKEVEGIWEEGKRL